MKAERSNNPAILLDLDGTLVDSVYEHVIAWAASLRSVGIVVPNWKIHRRIGMNGESMVRQLLREPAVGQRPITEALGRCISWGQVARVQRLCERISGTAH